MYHITIDTWRPEDEIDVEVVAELGAALDAVGAEGASTSFGGVAGGIGAVFGIVSDEGISADPWDVYAEISHRAVNMFVLACDKAGAPFTGIANLEIATEAYVERELEREPEGYVGTAELADYLKVSKQRVSELRRENRLPAPIAELRAGPVWTRSSLKRFVDTWDRTPGRRLTAEQKEELRLHSSANRVVGRKPQAQEASGSGSPGP